MPRTIDRSTIVRRTTTPTQVPPSDPTRLTGQDVTIVGNSHSSGTVVSQYWDEEAQAYLAVLALRTPLRFPGDVVISRFVVHPDHCLVAGEVVSEETLPCPPCSDCGDPSHGHIGRDGAALCDECAIDRNVVLQQHSFVTAAQIDTETENATLTPRRRRQAAGRITQIASGTPQQPGEGSPDLDD
jgi:hypothetical protein